MARVAPLRLHIGLKREILTIPSLAVGEAQLSGALENMGEFYILDMSKHNADYASAGMSIRQRSTVALPQGFAEPSTRTDSTNVIGNIGEAIGACVVQNLLSLGPQQIARVRRQGRRGTPALQRCPDFVVDVPVPG